MLKGGNTMDKKNPFEENELKDNNEETKEEVKEEIKEEAKEEQKEETKEEISEEEDKKYEELNNKYIRLAADFDNFRKRTSQEKQDLLKYGASEVLRKFISLLDTFERAQNSLKEIDNPQTIKEGYEVVYKQMIDAFKKVGIEEIDALGKEFNPAEHEAVTQIPTDEYEPNHVANILQKGYKLFDKVLRPAMVGVAKEKENE